MSTFGYQIEREFRATYRKRAAYLAKRAPNSPDPMFCQVMEAIIGEPPSVHAKPELQWRGFPWLTPVFGSGCLDIPDDPRLKPEVLAAAVRALIDIMLAADRDDEEYPTLVEERFDQPEIAARFTVGLVVDRSAETMPRDHPLAPAPTTSALVETAPPPGGTVEPVAARVVLVGALLTRFFFLARAQATGPLSRWEKDQAIYKTGGGSEKDEDMDQLVELSLWHLGRASAELDEPPNAIAPKVATAVQLLLKETLTGMGRGLRTHALDLTELRLVTEVAWHLLTLHTSVYPGWTDLLLSLMLRDPSSEVRRSRPRFSNLRTVSEMVPILFLEPTRQSWRARMASRCVQPDLDGDCRTEGDGDGDGLSERDHLFEAGAEMLWAQSEAVHKVADPPNPKDSETWHALSPDHQSEAFREWRDNRTALPPATAFVTGFDIELEMALWLSARDKPFFVVIPVHVFRWQNDNAAELCWLRGELRRTEPFLNDPDSELDERLRRPFDWELLTPDIEKDRLRAGPHIVHLSGAPLLQLPQRDKDGLPYLERLAGELGAVGVSVKPESLCLEHAVTVDEYLAFRQSEAELLWSTSHKADRDGRRSRALPPFLLGSSPSSVEPGTNRRFWMALGVPVGDTAIRHRMVSQITLHQLLTSGAVTPAVDAKRTAAEHTDPEGDGDQETESPPIRRRGGLGLASTEAMDGGGVRDTDASLVESKVGSRHLDGVVVNRRVNEDEASIFDWLGLDIVNASAGDFINDLRHYTRHLRASDDVRRPSLSLRCLVDPPTPQ